MNLSDGWIASDFCMAGEQNRSLTVMGLEFNTPDEEVKKYLNKFGIRVIDAPTKYGKYRAGPWRGLISGERIFQVDIGEAS